MDEDNREQIVLFCNAEASIIPRFVQSGTGSPGYEGLKSISYPFGKFVIKVLVKPSNEFVGITEVSLNKDFMSNAQRHVVADYHDVEEFYKE